MAGVHFKVTGDANGYIAATRQAEAATKGMVNKVTDEAKRIDNIFKTLATGAGTLFTVQMASQFSKQVAQVRGEFRQLEVAFETMLQSKEKADALMAQIVDTAAKTLFDLQGVANGAKQLLAYGVALSEVNDTLIRLGDIAAGLSIPLNDLVYLYGTTMTQGRLFTQDLRQFQGRGIPIAEELAKQFGVTKDAVGELVTAGKVGFPEVQKAIMAMTSEGGKFNNLMAKQSQTITGQISNLEDSISQMFNEIGKASEGTISKAIGMASSLVENYEKVGRIIGGLVTALGAYKVAVIALNAVDKARIAILAAQAVAQRASAVSAKQVTAATVLLTKAQKSLNIAMLANPYVIAAAAVAALGVGVYALVTAKTKEERIHERVNAQIDKYNENLDKQKQQLQELFDTLNSPDSTNMQRVLAMEQLRELYPSILKDLSDEELLKLSAAEATRRLTEENEKMLKSDLVSQIAEATKGYDEAMRKINSYKNRRSDAIVNAYTKDSGYQQATKDAEKYRIELEALLGIYNRLEETERKADFLALPADQKIISLKESNAELDREIEELDGKLKELKEKRDIASVSRPEDFTLGSMPGGLWQGTTEEQILDEIKARQQQKALNDKEIAENQAKVDADNKALSDKQRKANYDRQKAEQKAAEDLAKMKRDLNNKVAQADIDSMEDGYAKTIRQLEHQFDLENQAIEQQKKDLLKRKENDALQSWLAEDPENRKAYDFKYTATFTQEEEQMWEDMGRLAQESFDRGYKEAGEKWEKEAKFFQRQFEIDAMSHGAAKDAAQRQLDNEKELHNLELQRDAYIEAAKAAHLLSGAKEEDFDISTANQQFDVIISNTKAKQTAQSLLELKQKYEDFGQAVARIDKELAEETSLMKNADGTFVSGFSQENIDIATKQAENAKDALAVQYASMEEDFAVFTASLAEKTLKELTMMLAQAEMELTTLEDLGESDPDELARARAEVVKLKEQLKALRVDKGVKEANTNWADLNGVLSDAASKFSELGNIIPGMAGQMLSGIGSIATAAIGVANGITAIGKAASAAEKASAILAVISTVISVVQKFASAAEESKAANEAAANAARDYARALEEISNVERRNKYDTAFGEDSFGLFVENIKIAQEQLRSLKSELDEGTGWDASDLIDLTSQSSGWASFSKDLRDKIDSISDMMDRALVSDMRSTWQKMWGTGNDNLHVVSLDDFIDTEGMLDSEGLRAWYKSYGEGLTEEQKNIVEDLLAGWDAYYETLEGMDQYISDLFGDTIGNIADKWIESFEETGSAITDLKQISNDFAKSFAKDMLKSMLTAEVFNEENTQALLDLIKNGDTAGATAFYDNLIKQAEKLGSAATKIIQSTGIDTTSESTRAASEKGIAQASQESVTELNGRMIAIQSHTFSINERVGNIVNLTQQVLSRLTNIDNKMSRLVAIEDHLAYIRSDMSDMGVRGLKLKV